jgi:hypothetical protein
MDRKKSIHRLLDQCADELLEFIKECESNHKDHWVPTAYIKKALELNFVAVPRCGIQRGEKGWLFATLARMLEDKGLLDYEKRGSRSFCRSRSAI